MSQENKGSNDGRSIKIFCAIMMCLGMIFCFIWPMVGGVMLFVGFFGFVIGRFLD